MAVDYAKAAQLALRLIQENGRAITLVYLGQTPEDPAKPWRGNTDARNNPKAQVDTYGAFVPPSGAGLGFLSQDSELVKRAEQILLIAAQSVLGYNVEEFNEVIDPEDLVNTRWRIDMVEMLKPGPLRILYAVGVKR